MSNQDQLFPTPSNKNTTKHSTNKKPEPETIQNIWNHYITTHHTHTKNKPKLTEERIKLITRQLQHHTPQTLTNAITGCTLSPWHMGHNPNNRKYNNIELILRNTEKIETFANIHEQHETGDGFLTDPF